MPRAEIGDARQLLGELQGWVAIETPTTEPARVNALMDVAARELADAGAAHPGPRRVRRQSDSARQCASGREANPHGGS